MIGCETSSSNVSLIANEGGGKNKSKERKNMLPSVELQHEQIIPQRDSIVFIGLISLVIQNKGH